MLPMHPIQPKKRIRYRDLTCEQKKKLCNGCGGKGGWINPPNFCFRASCNHHDFNYLLGYRRRDRLRADWQFFRAMLKDAGKNVWLWFVAISYFLAVRIVGWKYFRYGERELMREDIELMCEDIAEGNEK